MRTSLLTTLLSAAFAITKDLITSPYDKCSYRHITLENKLEVLLVHDPGVKQAQVALDVNVGSMHEPNEYNGLAHFLEHMLFLGNSKYPDEGEFMRFIGMNSGTTNAFTDADNTNFHFWVRQEHLEGALDRFAQFFISPTFGKSGKEDDGKESGIMREMNAVDSEYRNIRQDEGFRLHRVVKLLCDEKHPFSRFHVGNLETLKKDGIVEAVIAFYKKHYSANLMKLVVRSGLELDKVETMIHMWFTAIPNLNVQPVVWKHPAIAETGKLVKYKLLQEGREVNYVFEFPGRSPYKNVPCEFLASLLKNDVQTGLLYQLKQQGLVLAVQPEHVVTNRGFSIFTISFALTPKGQKQLDTVTHNLFAYVEFLKESVNSKEVAELFEEYKQMHNLDELFAERDSQYAVNNAGWMHRVEKEEDLIMTPLDFDAKQLHKRWSYLTKENVNVVLSSDQFEKLPLKEEFYGIEYSMEKISWNAGVALFDFKLPQPNRFIPEDIQFYGNVVVPTSDPTERPDLITDGLWFKMDDSYGQPKSTFFISLESNALVEELHYRAAVGLYIKLIGMQMASFFQEVAMARIKASVAVKAHSVLEISISGFSDKLPKVLEMLVEGVTGPLDQKYFEVVKTQMIQQMKNSLLEPSYEQATHQLNVNLVDGFFPVAEIIEATKALVWEDMKPELLTALKPKMLVMGNTLRETAIQLFSKLKQTFRGYEDRKTELFDWNSVGHIFWRGPIEQADNAIAVYYPITTITNLHEFGAVLMLNRILSDAFFDALRTKEQLGYIVSMGKQTFLDSVGLMFKVQSKVEPRKLNERVQKFIAEEAKEIISKLTEEDLKDVKVPLIASILARHTSLLNEAQWYWRVITTSSDWFFERNFALGVYLHETPVENLKLEMLNILNMMSDPTNSVAAHIWGKGTEPIKAYYPQSVKKQ